MNFMIYLVCYQPNTLEKQNKTSILVNEKTEKDKGFTLVLVSGNGQKEIPKSNDITLENRNIANEDETVNLQNNSDVPFQLLINVFNVFNSMYSTIQFLRGMKTYGGAVRTEKKEKSYRLQSQ